VAQVSNMAFSFDVEGFPDWIMIIIDNHYIIDRKKFRSQTSDNMDKWKCRGGKNQRREEKRREEKKQIREEKESEESHETLCFFNILRLRKLEK
jgi:hypothetical protein